jgi:hypothetical protein
MTCDHRLMKGDAYLKEFANGLDTSYLTTDFRRQFPGYAENCRVYYVNVRLDCPTNQ